MFRFSRSRVRLLPGLGLAGLLMAGCEKPEVKTAAPPPQRVFVSHPTVDDVRDYEDFTGRTEAIFAVEVRSRVTGYLDKVHFKDGDDVKEGDPLLEIDARPYQAELNRTEAALAQSEAHLKRLEADYKRASLLINRGNISREEFDLIIGNRAEAEAAVGIARAQYDLAKLNVGYTKINSTQTGRLSRRLVDPGNLVQADTTPLTTIVALDPLYVYFDVDERTLLRIRRLIREGKVRSRQQADIPVMVALSDENDFPHKGVIDFSENRVDPGTGTLRVRAKIDNPKPYLLSPGLFVRVRLPVGDPHRSTLVAEKALGSEQGEKYVYVVKDKTDKGKPITDERGNIIGIADKVRVKVGKLEGDRRVIDSVLDGKKIEASDLVIVEGLQRVRPGAEVSHPPLDKTASQPPPASGVTKQAAIEPSPAPRG